MQLTKMAGAIGLALALGGTALANTGTTSGSMGESSSQSGQVKSTAKESPSGGMKEGTEQRTSMSTDTQAEHGMSVEGVVSQVKKDKVTLATPLGESTEIADLGDAMVLNRELKFVAVEGKVDKTARITRDGKNAKTTELKEGDFVRAAWNAKEKKFTSIDAQSSQQIEKQHGSKHSSAP